MSIKSLQLNNYNSDDDINSTTLDSDLRLGGDGGSKEDLPIHWYVHPTLGNDNNNGRSISTPFKTIFKVMSVVGGSNIVHL